MGDYWLRDPAGVLVVVVSVVLVVVSLTLAFATRGQAQRVKAAYYESRYGSSIDRMLAESPADHDQLRRLRDSERTGPVKAVRELLRSDPVPLKVAAEFIRRL